MTQQDEILICQEDPDTGNMEDARMQQESRIREVRLSPHVRDAVNAWVSARRKLRRHVQHPIGEDPSKALEALVPRRSLNPAWSQARMRQRLESKPDDGTARLYRLPQGTDAHRLGENRPDDSTARLYLSMIRCLALQARTWESERETITRTETHPELIRSTPDRGIFGELAETLESLLRDIPEPPRIIRDELQPAARRDNPYCMAQFEVIGLNRRSQAGTFLPVMIFSWETMVTLAERFAPDATLEYSLWLTNDGHGLDEEGSLRLADLLDEAWESGEVIRMFRDTGYIPDRFPGLVPMGDLGCQLRYNSFRPRLMKRVIEFLQDCGGFQIW